MVHIVIPFSSIVFTQTVAQNASALELIQIFGWCLFNFSPYYINRSFSYIDNMCFTNVWIDYHLHSAPACRFYPCDCIGCFHFYESNILALTWNVFNPYVSICVCRRDCLFYCVWCNSWVMLTRCWSVRCKKKWKVAWITWNLVNFIEIFLIDILILTSTRRAVWWLNNFGDITRISRCYWW